MTREKIKECAGDMLAAIGLFAMLTCGGYIEELGFKGLLAGLAQLAIGFAMLAYFARD